MNSVDSETINLIATPTIKSKNIYTAFAPEIWDEIALNLSFTDCFHLFKALKKLPQSQFLLAKAKLYKFG